MAAHVCTPIGDFFCPEDRPSPIFSTFSCVLNGIAFVWGLIKLIGGPCASHTRTWLVFGLILHMLNIVFAVYIYIRFAKKVAKEGQSAGQAAWKLLLYDWGVCLYLLALIFMIVWMIIAGDKAGESSRDDKCGKQLSTQIVFFVLYLIIGCILIFFSLFTECCRTPRWNKNNEGRRGAQQPTQQQMQTYAPGSSVVQAQPAQPAVYGQPAQAGVYGAQPAAAPPPTQQQPPAPGQGAYGQARPPPATNPNYGA